jgi:hypothetical protein
MQKQASAITAAKPAFSSLSHSTQHGKTALMTNLLTAIAKTFFAV